MNWQNLHHEDQLTELSSLSENTPVVLFKHSTRCSISSMALHRFERNHLPNVHASFYLLDILQHRNISNLIAEKFQVTHESPQLLLLSKGSCVYESSHIDISFAELAEQIESLA